MGRRLEGCRASCGGCPHLWPEHRRGNVTEVSPEQLQETCPQHGSSGLPLEHPHGVRGTSSETRGPCGDTSPCACLRQNEHKRGESPKPQPDTRHQVARAAPSSQGRWLATGHHCSGWDVAVTHPRPRPSPAHLIPPLGPSRGRMLHPAWDELGLHHHDQQPGHIWGPFSCSLGVAQWCRDWA